MGEIKNVFFGMSRLLKKSLDGYRDAIFCVLDKNYLIWGVFPE
jgi:hypothetical protein